MNPPTGEPWAWLVIAADGFRAVFITRPQAEKYAVATHGIVVPLVPADYPEA